VAVPGAEPERRPRVPARHPAVGDVPRPGAGRGEQPCQRGGRKRLPAGGGRPGAGREAGGGRRALDKPGVQVACPDGGLGEQRPQERDVGGDAEHGHARERRVQAAQRAGPVLAPRDDLGEHRVVVAGDRGTGRDPGVHAHVLGGRLAQQPHGAARGQEAARRVLRVDAGLHGVPGRRRQPRRQRLPRRDPDLPLHQVQAGHELGHRVLDLQPGVHLHEEELPGVVAVHDELDRARALVADGAGRLHRRRAHPLPAGGVEQHRGRLLDDLLVAALQAALPLAQVRHGPVRVGEHLDLDVPGAVHVPLDQQPAVAESRQRRPPRRLQGPVQLPRRAHHRHPLPAAAGRGLDDDGEPRRVRPGRVDLRDYRHPGGADPCLGGDLVPHRLDGGGGRPDEDQAGRGRRPRERRVLRQEAVAGVDRVGAGGAGGGEDRLDAEVAGGGGRGADPDRLVRLGHVPGAGVGVAVDGDAGDAHAAQRGDDPDGDLAAVGDEDLLQHC
jgi:hypothetical protein